MEFTKERIELFIKSPLEHGLTRSEQMEMARQLLAGLEQEPVAWISDSGRSLVLDGEIEPCFKFNGWNPLGYQQSAAPQLPQPAVMDEQYQHLSELYHAQEKRLFKIAQRIKGPSFDKYAYSPSQAIDVLESEIFGEREGDGRAAMLQCAEPVQEATTDNTSQQFESLGLIATSDERKMEAPRCGKHPETELQVHPFEQLLSYPPQPAMYCPLCRPSVAEWVEFDKQLRRQRNGK